MKTVFNNSQVCHVWANQSQGYGKSASIFFEDASIFSYGHHFKAGQIHTLKGKRFALVNASRYSPTTGQHLGHVRRALDSLMPYFESPDVSNFKSCQTHLDGLAQRSIEEALKKSSVKHKTAINYQFERIQEAFREANEFRALLGKPEKWPTKTQIAEVQKHLDARFKRYQELNTPEMIAKREAEGAKRAARAEKLERIKLADSIDKFRAGERVRLALRFEILRVIGDQIETSRGAQVPLKEGIKLLRALELGRDVNGVEVGSFQVIRVTQIGDDKAVKIGCHEILLSEARAVIGLKQARSA